MQGKAPAAAQAGAWARWATTPCALDGPFPKGCRQNSRPRRCKASPGPHPGFVLRLALGLFWRQRIGAP